MGKLRVMMRLWQGYALKVSLATSKNEFLYKYKSEDIPENDKYSKFSSEFLFLYSVK